MCCQIILDMRYSAIKEAIKLLSIKNNSVGSRTAAAGNFGAAIVAHVARGIRSRTNAVICN